MQSSYKSTIWEAASATAAVPSFFEAVEFQAGGEVWIDGGLGRNNPINVALQQVALEAEWKDKHIGCVLSLGTGVPRIDKISKNLAKFLKRSVQMMTDSEYIAEKFASSKRGQDLAGSQRYFRFSVAQGMEDLQTDECEETERMKALTYRYLSNVGSGNEVERCAKSLLLPDQNLVNVGSQKPTTFEELEDLTLQEKEDIKEVISSRLREHERPQAKREHLLDSLLIAGIYHRQAHIVENHTGTFEWIFDKSGRSVRPWDNLVVWLENGEGIYWISGKAGSGKSTLMSFLCEDQRTEEALKIWSGTKDLIMARLFFRNAGSRMQKNFDGFLRSLLYQILYGLPDMNILPSSVGSGLEQKRRRASDSQESIAVWTKRRLQETLHETITKLQHSCSLCLFVDGLDEIDDDEDDLIVFLRNIVSNTGVKVCLSSRPYREFEDAFSSSARLRLQDLTYNDIRAYVEDRFERLPQLLSMTSEKEYEMNKVKKRIVDRAEGVFLWVSLAVKDQIQGLQNDDSPEQLQERLANLPSEIEHIYTRMLDRIDKRYLRQASLFLQMTLYEPNLSVLELALASYPDLEAKLSSIDEIPKHQIVFLCRSTTDRLIRSCGGLLEVRENPSAFAFQKEVRASLSPTLEFIQPDNKPDKRWPASSFKPEITDAEILKLESVRSVNFIHCTVRDFLKTPGPGKVFLDTNFSPGFDPRVQSLKAGLGLKRLMEELNSPKAMVEAENQTFTTSASGRESPTFYSQKSFVDSSYASNRAYSTSNSSIKLEQAAHLGEQMRSRATADDEIQSIISDQDETELQESTGRLPQAAIATGLLANLLAENNKLSPLYKEALSQMGVRRFVNNFQRLLRQYYLNLRHNAKGNLELATCRLLKGQKSRKQIAERIAGLHEPENNGTREMRKRQADEDRSRDSPLERWIADNRGFRHTVLSADTPELVPDDTLQDQEENSSEEDASEDGNRATNLPHISEMESFVTGGDAFQHLVTNFRIFLTPTSLRSLARVIMSVPTDRIRFVESDDLSLSNKIKIFVESITEDNWNWWPLRAKMKMLQKDQIRLLWQCVSDTSNRALGRLLKTS